MSTPVQVIDTPVPTPAQAAAPVTGWRRAIADWLLVGGTTLVCHVLGAVTSLVLRFLLDPAQMGVWQGIKMLIGYANYANLGISKGAVRDLTVAQGSGPQAQTQAREGLNLAFAVNTLSSAIYALAMIAGGVWIGLGGGPFSFAWSSGLILVGLLAVLSRYVTFHVTILRGQQSFTATSRLSLIEGTLTLVVVGLTTWRFGLLGLYFGTLVVTLASMAYVWRYRGASLHWAWNGPKIRRLIGIGGPILAATTLFIFFRSLDKLMILAYMTDREYQLGCYSLALMVAAQIYGLGGITGMVMSPRYGEKFGQSANRTEVARLTARTGELQAVAMSLVGGLSLVLAGPVLGRLLPSYEAGLGPTTWLIPGTVLLTMALPVNQYMIAINRQRRALLVVVAAIIFAAVANHRALSTGHGLTGVAVATTAAYAAYYVLLVAVSIWVELPSPDRRRFTVLTSLALAPTLGTAMIVANDIPLTLANWSTLAGHVVLVLLVWSLSAASVWHFGRWREHFART